LFENEGLTEEIKIGFIATLLGSNRPINEMLRPNFQDQRAIFDAQFAGMTSEPFIYEDFETTRERLVKEIHLSLTDDDGKLLVSFKEGTPEWSLYPLEGLQDMPSVQWKFQNIGKLMNNSEKHKQQLDRLKKCFDENE
jgi:hypothetical protein